MIMKKRNGEALYEKEIQYMINGYTKGEIPDYQMSAMTMAIYFQGMNEQETLALTMAMAHSGDMLDLSDIHGVKVDKHSTGGVGDKTSLALTPMVAALGIPVAKMSGRGLGHTGGTIDKLESFTGFSTAISEEQFKENVNRIGIAIMGQTADLAPADKKLYALRDVTATVDNMSLIASSIMSKKLAAGEEDAAALAKEMVKLGKGAGRKTFAVISDMDQPLGFAVGNALEVKEAIDTLNGKGPEDFVELCMTLGSQMILAAGKAESTEQARDEKLVYHPEKLPVASMIEEIPAPQDGYIQHIVCDEIGMCSLILGGGRETKESEIDLSVGLVLHKKVGDQVIKGESLATIHGNSREKIEAAKERFLNAYTFSTTPVEKKKLIKGIIS